MDEGMNGVICNHQAEPGAEGLKHPLFWRPKANGVWAASRVASAA